MLAAGVWYSSFLCLLVSWESFSKPFKMSTEEMVLGYTHLHPHTVEAKKSEGITKYKHPHAAHLLSFYP